MLHSYKMPAEIIDGNSIAREFRRSLAPRIEQLKAHGVEPSLAVVLVGDDPASASYVRGKRRASQRLGITVADIVLPDTTSQAELLTRVERLNADESVHGILVQLPLPEQIDPAPVVEAISPEKDVDGFHPVNLGRLLQGSRCFLPCTPAGILELLSRSGVKVAGANVVIVGRSNIVGKPLAAMLMQKRDGANATVTVCHSATEAIERHLGMADIVVVAVGAPGTIKGDMIAPGSVVVDVGVNRVEAPESERGYRLVGDVDYDSVSTVASKITPVPGGVGPMTISMLLANTVQAAEQTAGRTELNNG